MSGRVVRVGTRSSVLAMAQTDEVVSVLRAAWPEARFDIVPVRPDGDRRKSAPLLSLGRGTFVKGVEERLLSGEVDIAVHSTKDMPSVLPEGLEIAAYSKRKDPRDVVVNRWSLPVSQLPEGARLGTSSPRRSGQLLSTRSDIEIVPLRGNVDSRMSKVGTEDYDGVVLAAAALERLGRLDEVTEYLTPEVCVPDAGQGALAIEVRAGEDEIAEIVSAADDRETHVTVTAERAFVDATGGGCRVPVAALAELSGAQLDVRTMSCLPDGSQIFRNSITVSVTDPVAAGQTAAKALIETGAGEIMYGTDRN